MPGNCLSRSPPKTGERPGYQDGLKMAPTMAPRWPQTQRSGVGGPCLSHALPPRPGRRSLCKGPGGREAGKLSLSLTPKDREKAPTMAQRWPQFQRWEVGGPSLSHALPPGPGKRPLCKAPGRREAGKHARHGTALSSSLVSLSPHLSPYLPTSRPIFLSLSPCLPVSVSLFHPSTPLSLTGCVGRV